MDLTKLATFLNQYGTWGVLLAGVLVVSSDKWLPLVKGLFSRTTEPTEAERDIAEVAALRLLQDRAKRSGCPKFLAAVHAVEPCFFNKAEAAK